jgi:hypothetical protein
MSFIRSTIFVFLALLPVLHAIPLPLELGPGRICDLHELTPLKSCSTLQGGTWRTPQGLQAGRKFLISKNLYELQVIVGLCLTNNGSR